MDDGSRDGTFSRLSQWASENSGVKVLALSRNFGHQNAATAGLDYASGEAIVLMDADLQDPPELILQMLEDTAMATMWCTRSALRAKGKVLSKGLRRGRFIASCVCWFNRICRSMSGTIVCCRVPA